MKKVFIFILALIIILLLIFLIVNRTGEIKDNSINYASEGYTWKAVIGAQGDELVRGEKIDAIKNDLAKLIAALNKSDQDPEAFRNSSSDETPKIKLIDVQGNTLNVEVINDTYLTQRMGTLGASAFMAVATFTLTEYNGIQFVHFNFNEGDHAAPGVYSRQNFLQDWKVGNKQ